MRLKKLTRQTTLPDCRGKRGFFWGLGLGWLLLLLFSLAIGRYVISPEAVVSTLLHPFADGVQGDPQIATVIWRIRLPRVLAAALLGAALAVSGAVFQGMFRNPLVSPDVLGASQGCALGAALGILLGLSYWQVTGLAFILGLLTVALTYLIGRQYVRAPLLGLVLAGIMMGSLLGAGLSLVKLLADPTDQLPSITYWLLGSLASIRATDLAVLAPLIGLSIAVLVLLRYRINYATLPEQQAATMGVQVGRLRVILIMMATLLTAASVSFAGLIGWIGLVVPHLSRQWVGPDFRRLLPATALLGSCFLLAVDDLARTLTTSEIPLGVLTALVGAPFFLSLICKGGQT